MSENRQRRNLKEAHQSALFASDGSTVKFYNSLQLDFTCAAYLSSVQSFDSRRLISRFRRGCLGLHVDTGRWAAVKLSREDRVCQVCDPLAVEDEQHFLLHCPAYDHIRHNYLALSSGDIPTVACIVNTPHAPLFGRYLKHCFSHRRDVLGQMCRGHSTSIFPSLYSLHTLMLYCEHQRLLRLV